MSTSPRPFLPSDIDPARSLVRAAVCFYRAALRRPIADPEAIARDLYSRDPATIATVQRAATDPATTDAPGWAGEFSSGVPMTAFVAGLAPVSTAAGLFSRGLMMDLPDGPPVFVPAVVSSASAAAFVAEGAPVPAVSLTTLAAPLEPRRITTIVSISRSAAKMSNPALEGVVRAVLGEAVTARLDAVAFDAAAADTERPAGLLYGAIEIAPTGNTMAGDLADLAAAVAAISGGDVAFIGAVPQAIAMRLAAGPQFTSPVFASAALPAGTVVCVATRAIASGFGAVEFDASEAATIHMEDTNPEALSAAGSPATVAAPIRSLYQTATIGLRLVAPISWTLRAPGAVSVINGTTW